MTQTESGTVDVQDDSPVALENRGAVEGIETEIINVLNPDYQNSQTFDDADEVYLQDLIGRMLCQDQAALSALFKAMSARVHSIALRITGSVQLAEEVSEDTFFQVWRQAPRFDPVRGTAKAWILTIARTRALDARRSIPPFDSEVECEMDANSNFLSHDGLPDLLLAIEQNQMLHSALKTLEPLPRQLISLAFFRGLTHDEIADHTKLPLGTVKSHLRRAIIHLREAISATTHTTVMQQ